MGFESSVVGRRLCSRRSEGRNEKPKNSRSLDLLQHPQGLDSRHAVARDPKQPLHRFSIREINCYVFTAFVVENCVWVRSARFVNERRSTTEDGVTLTPL